MIDSIVQFDQQLFIYLNQLGNSIWDPFWTTLTVKWTSIPLYVLLLLLMYKKLGWKNTLIILVSIALLITICDQFSNLIKHTVKRPRPCQMDFGTRTLANCGRYGFPSAHALNSMALAFFLGAIFKPYYKWIFPFLFFWACLLGYSRIYVGVHYPGDVLTGLIVGGLFGFFYFKIFRHYFSRNLQSV